MAWDTLFKCLFMMMKYSHIEDTREREGGKEAGDVDSISSVKTSESPHLHILLGK